MTRRKVPALAAMFAAWGYPISNVPGEVSGSQQPKRYEPDAKPRGDTSVEAAFDARARSRNLAMIIRNL